MIPIGIIFLYNSLTKYKSCNKTDKSSTNQLNCVLIK